MTTHYSRRSLDVSVGDMHISTPDAGGLRGGAGFANNDWRFWSCWWTEAGMPTEPMRYRGCRAVINDYGDLVRAEEA